MDPSLDRDISDPLIGRLLDRRYRIGPRIARGGMASVYEATDIRLDRTVAVKVMHPGMGDDESFAARFVREARAAARLSHPHVVAVYDQGDEDGTVFLAMEYVPGHTLRDVIRKESPMAPAKALALLDPVLSALAAAHRAGLIHRDIKPENVLIADEAHGGGVKVADFGLAKAINADTQHTATGGVLIGTVSYLAPELVVEGKADERADVYAAGVMLYELLTGRKPHEGDSPIQVAYKHVHEDIPAPSLLVPGLPAYVDALVARATARDRGLRPADARVFLHQLHRVKQALDEGVVDDPDLVADLALPVAANWAETTGELTEDYTEEGGATVFDDSHATSIVDATAVRAAVPPSPARAVDDVLVEGHHRRRRGPFALLAALLAAILVVTGTWWFGFARYTSTPGVIGLTEAAAERKVEAAGLGFEVARSAFSETVPAGSVISTDPSPGERIPEDGTVEAVISKGLERYDVPDLRGLEQRDAEEAIAEASLEFGRAIEKFHEEIPAGQVIRSRPEAGTPLKKGTPVDLVVSKGPKPIPIEDWTGKSAAKAIAAFQDAGLKVDVTEEFSDDVAEGKVISQDPTSGELFKGDTVALVVSRGPELVEIPSVRAQGVDSARDELEDLGLKVKVRRTRGYLGLGYVFSVSPGEGEQVPKGTTVTLYIV